MSLVKLDKITKSYRFGQDIFSALRDVTLSLAGQELVILSGPSCSGKTTLLNILGLVNRPSSGRVFYRDQELTNLSEVKLVEYRRREIGFLGKAGNLLPSLTVAENIQLPLQLLARPERQAVTNELLGTVGLSGFANKMPAQLNLSQRLRAALAQALVKEPKLILIDEPTAFLDLTNGQSFMKLVQEFKQASKVTVVVSTTDPMVMAYGERIIRLYDGRIEADERC
jgi:putative ABC transport system ATP-binding protein